MSVNWDGTELVALSFFLQLIYLHLLIVFSLVVGRRA
jgi:hypothetical protein